MRQIYQAGLSRKNLSKRLLIIIALVFPSGFLILFVGSWFVFAIKGFCKLVGLCATLSGGSGGINANAFLPFFIDAAGAILVYFLPYAILRFGAKLKTHYIDMTLILAIVSAVMAPALNGHSGDGGLPIPDYGFIFAVTMLFDAIIFGSFSMLTALLDKFTALKEWLKFVIALIAAVSAGMLISRLAWIPIIGNYLK